MTGKERIIKALQGKATDRIPVVNIFHQSYVARELGIKGSVVKAFLENPWQTIIALQDRLKHDPVVNLYTYLEPGITTWPGAILKWSAGDSREWIVEEKILKYDDSHPVIERTYHTPKGTLQAIYRREPYQKWVLEPPLKEDSDFTLLNYRPAPEKLDLSIIKDFIRRLNNYAFTIIDIRGTFDELCSLRGLTETMYDIYDRPQQIKAILELLRDYTVRLVKRLGDSGIDAILLNESSVGLGMSPEAFEEFVLPYDQAIARAAKEKGMLVSYHICGKSDKLLELMAESGADALETLAPLEVSGDVDLARAKKRVGDKVALWGGFNERVLATRERERIKNEVKRCLSAAADGGGYILRGAGQIYEASPVAWEAFNEAVEEFNS